MYINVKTKKFNFAWLVYIGCFLVAFTAIGLINNERSLYLQPAADGLGVSRMTISLAYFVGNIINFFISTMYGKLNKRFGIRKLMLFGLACMVIGNFLFVISPVYIGYFFGEVFIGIGFGCATMTTISLFVRNWFGNYHGTLLGVIYMATGLGTVCFTTLIGNLITNYGYRYGFMFHMAALAVTTVIGFFVFFAEPKDRGAERLFLGKNKGPETNEAEAVEAVGLTMAEARKKPVFYIVLILTFVTGFGIMCVQGTYAAFMDADIGFGTVFAASIVSVVFTFNCIFKIPVGIVADKFGVVTSLVICCVSMGIASVALTFLTPQTQWLAYLFAFGLGTGNIMVTVSFPLVAPRVFGTKDVAAMTAIVMGCINLGAACGGFFPNLLFQVIGTYRPIYITMIAVFIICLIGMIVFIRPAYSKEAGAAAK